MPDHDDYICGVERDLVERFLELIRDQYPHMDRAAFFLESKTGTSSLHGITNMRDVLSHLSTMLDPKTPPDKRAAHVTYAEEHLRRATQEPYEVAFYILINDFSRIYENYKDLILPVRAIWPAFLDAPTIESIDSEMSTVHRLASDGRRAKGTSLRDPEWEEGIAALVEAHSRLSELSKRLGAFLKRLEVFSHTPNLNPRSGIVPDTPDSPVVPVPSTKDETHPALLMTILNLTERIRVGFRSAPDREKDVQNVFETLLVGASVSYCREADRFEYATKSYIPDFTVDELGLAVELKLCHREGRQQEIIAEINDDILGYRRKFPALLFVVYDLGQIRDVARFTAAFADHEGVMVRVIKH